MFIKITKIHKNQGRTWERERERGGGLRISEAKDMSTIFDGTTTEK
jgi:hypothetical protein